MTRSEFLTLLTEDQRQRLPALQGWSPAGVALSALPNGGEDALILAIELHSLRREFVAGQEAVA